MANSQESRYNYTPKNNELNIPNMFKKKYIDYYLYLIDIKSKIIKIFKKSPEFLIFR